MNRKRKAIILICIAIPTVFFLNLARQPHFWKLVLRTKEMTVQWMVYNETKEVFVVPSNEGYATLEIVRVEVIYLPDETLGLIWIEQRSLERYSSTAFVLTLEDHDFFNLLLEGANKVRIEVETKSRIWIFYPQEFGRYVEPTSVESK